MGKIILYITILLLVIAGIMIYIIFKRNYFNKYKYIRLVKYNDDMTINISYIKKEVFNTNQSILINPKHVYNYNGYTSIITTSESNESINPIDFESKFDAKDFKSAIRSKLISETFDSLKVSKFDKIMLLIGLNAIQLLAIIYLIYSLLGAKS